MSRFPPYGFRGRLETGPTERTALAALTALSGSGLSLRAVSRALEARGILGAQRTAVRGVDTQRAHPRPQSRPSSGRAIVCTGVRLDGLGGGATAGLQALAVGGVLLAVVVIPAGQRVPSAGCAGRAP